MSQNRRLGAFDGDGVGDTCMRSHLSACLGAAAFGLARGVLFPWGGPAIELRKAAALELVEGEGA